jgi:hypothetical protein
MSDVPKVIRDGKVAVIVSPGFGAGWSTWAHTAGDEAAVFAPDVIAWIESGRTNPPNAYALFAEKYGYTGGLGAAVIEWVDVGTRFEISEYDGSEDLRILTPETGYVA